MGYENTARKHVQTYSTTHSGEKHPIHKHTEKTNLKFNNNPFPLLYYCHLHDWDYTKAPIHRREEYYTYRIRKSEDGNDIENFDIAINSRGSGDSPYEGPEYEKYINHLD